MIAFDAKQPLFGARELWSYREVLYALVLRDVKVRYAQTVAGAAWVILQPLLTTGVLTLLAGRWMRVPAGDLAYPLFVYSGLVPWMYLTHVLTKSSLSLINTGLLSKAYFPRLLLPLAVALGAVIDLCVTSAVLACLMIYYGVLPSPTIVLLPVALLLAAGVAFGFGVWLAVLNLFQRDVAHALPFATQLLFFVTPVAYPMTVVPASWRPLYSLNPMVAVVECWRWALFGPPPHLSPTQLAGSLGVAAAVIVSGLWYFARHAPTLADVGEM